MKDKKAERKQRQSGARSEHPPSSPTATPATTSPRPRTRDESRRPSRRPSTRPVPCFRREVRMQIRRERRVALEQSLFVLELGEPEGGRPHAVAQTEREWGRGAR